MVIRIDEFDIPYHAVSFVFYNGSEEAVITLNSIAVGGGAFSPTKLNVHGKKNIERLRAFMETNHIILNLSGED